MQTDPIADGGRGFDLPGTAVLALAGGLLLLTPFGHQATTPWIFLVYRLLLIGAAATCFLDLRNRAVPDFPLRLYLAGGAALGLMLLSVWTSPGRNPMGLDVWFEHTLFAGFFIALARFASLQSSRWKTALLLTVTSAALVQLLLFLLSRTKAAGIDPVFVNPNYFAAYLLPAFGCAVAATFYSQNLRWRLIAGMTAAALLFGMTDSASRGATLAAFGVLALALSRLGNGRLMAGGALAVAVLAGVAAVANPDLVRKFTDRGEIDPYNYTRLEIWAGSLEMAADRPLLGVGPARYESVARRYRFPVEGAIGRYMKRAEMAHSEYLQYTAEVGIPAAMLLVGLVGYYLYLLHRKTLTTKNFPSSERRGGRRPGWSSSEQDGLMTTPDGPGGPSGVVIEPTPLNETNHLFTAAALLAGTGVGLHAFVDNVFHVPVVLAVLVAAALSSAPLIRTRKVVLPGSVGGQAVLGLSVAGVLLTSSFIPALAYHANGVAWERRQAGRIEEAAAAARFAVALRPNDGVLLTNLGIVHKHTYQATGDDHQLFMAEAYLQRAMAADPDLLAPRQEYADLLMLRLTGEPTDAFIHRRLIAANQAILELDPFLPLVRSNLAQAYFQTGAPDRAFETLRQAIAFEPNFVPGYLQLAEWEATRGAAAESEKLRAHAAAIAGKYADRAGLTEYELRLLGRAGPGG